MATSALLKRFCKSWSVAPDNEVCSQSVKASAYLAFR